MNSSPYPNAYFKLHFSKMGPGVPEVKGEIEIWLMDSQFRVRDQTGRYAQEILADLQHVRGLGNPPAGMEEIMDLNARASNGLSPDFVEFSGNWESGKGKIIEEGGLAWEPEINQISALAEMVLVPAELPKGGSTQEVIVLGKPGKQYTFRLQGLEDGVAYETQGDWTIYGPFILKKQMKDSKVKGYLLTWEVLDFSRENVKQEDFGQ